MAGQAKRASELRELAELVADVLTAWRQHQCRSDYRPTILDGAMAAAFDLAMARSACPVRAWRGSKAATPNALCVACSEPLSMHSRAQMLTCATARS